MTMKKTVRVPLTSDGVPVVVSPTPADKTREIPAYDADDALREARDDVETAAPREVVDDEITVPVQSSIESTVTFEMLRRQSTEEDDEE